MLLKACQALGVMLLAMVVQIGHLAKIGIRKGYDDRHENQRLSRQVGNDLKQELKWNWNDPSRLPLDDPSEYKLSLAGKLEPVSDLRTVNLSDNSSKSFCFCV